MENGVFHFIKIKGKITVAELCRDTSKIAIDFRLNFVDRLACEYIRRL